MKQPIHFIWLLCTVFALVVLALTTPLHGWQAVATVAFGGAAVGFMLLLALIGLTYAFAFPLWEQLFGPASNESPGDDY